MILDVGCGPKPMGDVNVDLYRITYECIKNKGVKTGADVIASVEYLPFKDGTFDLVHSSHCIEHTTKPKLVLKECIRVSKDKINIICPHHTSPHLAKRSYHRSYYDELWFERNIPNNLKYEIKTYSEVFLPMKLLKINRYIRWGLRRTLRKIMGRKEEIDITIYKIR